MTIGSVDGRPSVFRLVLVPALITLGVTLLRLAGELWGGPPALFNKTAGGGGSLIGIVWLIPIFGFYFGRRLVREGGRPEGVGHLLGFTAGAVVVLATFVAGAFQFPIGSVVWVLGLTLGPWISAMLIRKGWPALGTTLIAYGLAARIPVALVMLAAILGNWGTHYDVPPSPDFPPMSAMAKWFAIGLVPQLTLWIGITAILGSLGAAVALALTARAARPVASAR